MSADRRRRVRRLILGVHAVTAVAHLVLALALGAWLEDPDRWVVAIALWGVMAFWLGRLGPDRRRPLWRTRFVDEPLFAHWGGLVFGMLLLPGALALALGLGATTAEAGIASYALGLALAAWGVWGRRRWVRTPEVEVVLEGLGEGFDGYRIVHLTDLHIGSFDRRARGLSWARTAARLSPDLVAVTGDLVTSGTAFHDDVAAVLASITAPDGVVVTLGNHDQWDDRALGEAIARGGAKVLRNEAFVVRRGEAELLVAGVDDPYTGKNDLEVSLADARATRPTVLLSHYPSLFERAAALGAALVLSGHTHGGQLGVPFLAARLNFARWTGQRGRGLYRAGAAQLFVSAGLGTTGPPMRIGIAPEIPVIVLRRGTESATT